MQIGLVFEIPFDDVAEAGCYVAARSGRDAQHIHLGVQLALLIFKLQLIRGDLHNHVDPGHAGSRVKKWSLNR